MDVLGQILGMVSRPTMAITEADSALVKQFVSILNPLAEKEAVELRKETLNQMYKLDTMNRLDSPYILSLLQVLRRLSKEVCFWHEMNVKMFFDIYCQVSKWATYGLIKSHASARDDSLESELKREVLLVCLSRLVKLIQGTFSLSVGGIAGPGLVEKLGKKVYLVMREIYRLEFESKILEYLTDSVYWMVEAAKDESQIDLYSLKNGLTSSHMVDNLLLQLKQTDNVELKMRVVKITEFFSDHRDFFLLIEQKRLFDELLSVLESSNRSKVESSLEAELNIGILGYFLKGVRHGIFKDQKLPHRLTGIALSKIS